MQFCDFNLKGYGMQFCDFNLNFLYIFLGVVFFIFVFIKVLRGSCLIKHDWEILERDTDYSLLFQWTYYRRVCMKCGKAQDTLNPWKNKIALAEEKTLERKRKAAALYGLDIKEGFVKVKNTPGKW